MNRQPWLTEPAEWTGRWWLPDDPETVIAGVLRYQPDNGPVLSLVGGFSEQSLVEIEGGWQSVEIENLRWPVLHGIASGRRVTLLDCLPVASKSYGFLGLAQSPDEQQVKVTTALVGVHLDRADEHVFTSCEIALEDLTAWAAESPLSVRITTEGDRQVGGSVEATTLDSRTARRTGVYFRLMHYQTIPNFENQRGSTTGYIRHFATVQLQRESSASLADLRHLARGIQDLVSLGVHRAAGLLWMKLALPPENAIRPEGFPTLPREVQVYERPSSAVGDPNADRVLRGVLFSCDTLPFETVVPRWFELRDQYAAAINLLLALRYAPGGDPETQVSTAVTAAEAMHRALNLGPLLPPEEWTALKKLLVDAAPSEHRQLIHKRLGSNEPSLRQRLLQLAREAER